MSSKKLSPFHLAFPVHSVDAAREFYGDLLGCAVGRSDELWVDFDFFGHQLVAHFSPEARAVGPGEDSSQVSNAVDGHNVPVPHFGVVLPWDDWQRLSEKLLNLEIAFVIKPYTRFAGKPGEQATMFFLDPSGNALEFKSFKDPSQIFAT